MTVLKRGMIIDVNLDPTKKVFRLSRLFPSRNGVREKLKSKPMLKLNPRLTTVYPKNPWPIACKPVPLTGRYRLVNIRGRLSSERMLEINQALKAVFELDND